MKIWERYLFFEALKTCLLFLGCFYFLYAAIDYSTHMQDFIIDKKIHLSHLLKYYGFMLIKRCALLLPMALLISTIRLLTSLSAHGELVALQTAGISTRRLIRPLLWLGLFAALVTSISNEYFLPKSLNFLDHFRSRHFKHAHTGSRSEPIHSIPLIDGSTLIARTKDKATGEWVDLFWIRSLDNLWKMQSLDLASSTGYFVDHIERNSAGHLEKTESFEVFQFPPFETLPNPTGRHQIPAENHKISTLIALLHDPQSSPVERPQLLTQLLFKCLIPFLPLLLILSIFPYCIRHHRSKTDIPLYAIALFGCIAFCALLDACVILSESQVISPWIAMCTPFFPFIPILKRSFCR